MAETVQLNVRIDAELDRELQRIAEQEALRKTDVARRYLIEGARAWRLEQAVRRFQEDRVSLGRAAEEAGLALYDMIDELRRRGIVLDRTTPDEARAELARLIAELPGRYAVPGDGEAEGG